jgi:hypothetical protein
MAEDSSLRIEPGGDLVEFLSRAPEGAKRALERGVKIVEGLPPERQQKLFAFVAENVITTGYGADISTLQSALELPDRELRDAIGLASMLLIVFSAGPRVSASNLLEAAASLNIFQAEQHAAIRKLAEIAQSYREKAKTRLAESETARAVLPSLTRFVVTVDLRLAFEGDKVTSSVPVLLAYIATDARDQHLWLQLTKQQAETLIADLQAAVTRMTTADRLVTVPEKKP